MENPIKMDDLGVPLFSETSSSTSSTGRKYPERFSDDIFRDSLPELEFRLEEVEVRLQKVPFFFGFFRGSESCDRNC